MYYHLFLPGGIGGYKVYLLRQRFPGKTTVLVRSLLLDRVSGVLALGMLAAGGVGGRGGQLLCQRPVFSRIPAVVRARGMTGAERAGGQGAMRLGHPSGHEHHRASH